MHKRASDAYIRRDVSGYIDTLHPELEYTQIDGRTIGRDELAHDVRVQLARIHSAETEFRREALEVDGGSGIATETSKRWFLARKHSRSFTLAGLRDVCDAVGADWTAALPLPTGGSAMSHELYPKADRPPLPIDEIIRRLRVTFAHVEIDVEEASSHLEEEIRYLLRTGGRSTRSNSEEIERVRRSIGRAVYVVLADDPNADATYVSFLLEPEHECIFISYESGRHEEASRELRERLVRVLDYDMDLV